MEIENSPRTRREGRLGFELEPYYQSREFRSMNALEILRETVRILRYNSSCFMAITALLICPVSAIVLSNVLVDQSLVKRLTTRLLLVARSSGLPLRPFVKQSCQRFAEMAISSVVCFPLYASMSLLSKAAVVYSVDCSYARKRFDSSKFFAVMGKIWKRLVSTYVWGSMAIVGSVALFFLALAAASNALSVIGATAEVIVYAAVAVGLVFSVAFANAVVVCSIAVVISVLEEVSGPEAVFRAGVLIRGQTHVGLLIFLGSAVGTAFVEGLFEHRVKALSYGDGSSRLWEGPLLVLMNSFVVLVDSMMSAVFYYSCRSSSSSFEASGCSGGGESRLVSDAVVVVDESSGGVQ